MTHNDALVAEINRGKALELKIAGATYREIASTLGVSVSTAHGYIEHVMEEVRKEQTEMADVLKRIALARLNKMRVSLWTKREQPRVADTLLRIDEREAKLMGLDAPLRWEGSGPGGGPIPVSGEIDLSKLTVDQLKQLEEIVLAASAAAQAAAPVATIAANGEPEPTIDGTKSPMHETIPLLSETIAPLASTNGDHPT